MEQCKKTVISKYIVHNNTAIMALWLCDNWDIAIAVLYDYICASEGENNIKRKKHELNIYCVVSVMSFFFFTANWLTSAAFSLTICEI